MINNMHQHGFNSCVNGLYINWNKNGVNYNGTGKPDSDPCERHDRLTDLRYLANLWRYSALFKSHAYDDDIKKYTPIVLTEFDHVDPRGWVYNEFRDMAELSGDPRYTAEVNKILAAFAEKPMHPNRVDWIVEQSSALIQSGVPQYVSIGKDRLSRTMAQYLSPQWGLVFWGEDMDVKTVQQLDIAIALAKAGDVNGAKNIVKSLAPLWDNQFGGFYEGATISGNSLKIKDKKTGGRMAETLELAKLIGDQSLLSKSLPIVYGKVYLADLNGVVYEQRPDWSLYTIYGSREDWVTSEAMGLMLEALFRS